jgi:prepilin-type N-terminal cleavage/methylation domain-containing protein
MTMLRRQGPVLPAHRPAFTLLEVMLAMAIGVFLLAALYVAVDVQLRHAQIGREIVEQSTLARALLTRMGNDISPSVAPALPANTATSSSSSSSSGGTTSSTTSSTGSTGTTGTGTSSSSTTSSPATSVNGAIQFNLGVQGDTSRLILSISRVPRELNFTPDTTTNPDSQPGVCDLRRITYWLAGGGGTPLGLARQELKLVTSDDANDVPPDVPDEASYVIADEVKSLTFSYFDGNAWQDSWDGTMPGADGMTPMGPPLAIAITVGISSGSPNPSDGEQNIK